MSLHLLKPEEKSELFLYLEQRFGVETKQLSDYSFFRTTRDIFIAPKDSLDFSHLEIEKFGLRSFNGDKHPPKPTSSFLQRFAHLITLSIIDLNQEELIQFMKGERITINPERVTRGYVAIRFKGLMVGCGFLRENELQSQFSMKTAHSINLKNL